MLIKNNLRDTRKKQRKKSMPKIIMSPGDRRVDVNITMDVKSRETLDMVSKEMNMSRSRFVEFMINSMKRSDELSMADYIKETLKDVLKAQRNKE